jgi:error-prone DNA polymerase
MSFVELRAHTAFSFGDGVCTPESLVTRAAEYGYPALGVTDHADLGGLIRFALAAESAGMKAIAGAELKVDGYPTAFLARNRRGYRNLATLVTKARMGELRGWGSGQRDGGSTDGRARARVRGVASCDSSRSRSGSDSGTDGHALARARARGFTAEGPGSLPSSPSPSPSPSPYPSNPSKYAVPFPDRGLPELTFDDVAANAEGLYCLTGPAAGEVATYVRSGRTAEAMFLLDRWRDVFGSRLVMEVQLHHAGGHEAALATELIETAQRARVQWAVANEPRYLDGAGRLVHDLLTALRADVCVNTAASWGLLLPNGEWRLKSPAEMALLWRGRERGLEATHDVADDCDGIDLRWLRPPLPNYPVPRGHDDDSYLRVITYAGASERWGELDARQTAQLEHELGVIRRLGFAGFFLVMWDAIRFAREQKILCQGRGSAANSAVAYCLAITAVDPVKHGLLFERFLSEVRTDGRTEAPDIDVDFEMHRREEVLDYMYQRYERQHAAITAVTQAFHAPTAIQDCMRALGYQAELAFTFSKRLHGAEPSEAAASLQEGLAQEHGLDVAEPRGRALLSALSVLDDVPRLRSTHPGGFVLSCEPLGAYMPIEQTTMGRTILQFDKDDLDAAGVPKFDFLGLGGLSAIHLAFDAIEKRTGETLEMYRLPVDDARTYELIERGDTVGTFQIESRAQIQSILQTKPDRLYDIVVQVALIRPGPIQARFVHPYTERRRGREEVHYAHPVLEPILRRTYGVPIFQEQAMAIAMALGGFSAGEADELRRAMGHHRKLPRLKAALDRLRNACIARGVEESVANQVVTDLVSFANYGFPESHAWSFALIAYATAWLKANHPAEFFLGLLNAWPMGFYPPATLVHDARRHGVPVVGPCMRDGEWDCDVLGNGNSISISISNSNTRHDDELGGTRRTPSPSPSPSPTPTLRIGWRHIRGLGEKTKEALQTAHSEGPFESIRDVVKRAKLTRADAIHLARAGAFEAFEPGRRKAAWEALRSAGDLLPLAPARVLPFAPAELEGAELIFLDYLATGICVHGHPLEHLRARLDAAGVVPSRDLSRYSTGERIVVAGLVVARQHPETANGTVFVLLEDEFGYLNIIVPAKTYQRNREVVKYSPFLVIEGRFEREDQVMNVIGHRFRELSIRPKQKVNYRSRDFH